MLSIKETKELLQDKQNVILSQETNSDLQSQLNKVKEAINLTNEIRQINDYFWFHFLGTLNIKEYEKLVEVDDLTENQVRKAQLFTNYKQKIITSFHFNKDMQAIVLNGIIAQILEMSHKWSEATKKQKEEEAQRQKQMEMWNKSIEKAKDESTSSSDNQAEPKREREPNE